MSKEYVVGDRESSRSYSRAVRSRGGTTVYLAGVTGGTTDAQGKPVAGDFPTQVHGAFARLKQNVEAAGGTLDDIVTMTVFITDSRYGDLFVELRKAYFKNGYPASALIGVHSLARPEMLLEIQAIAVIDD